MKRILVLNFFPAFFPPKSGGELRYYNMYRGLSRFYDVTLLSPTYNDQKEEVVTYSDCFREYRVPKEDIHNQLHWSIEKEKVCPEISALVCYLSAKTKNRYHERYLELYSQSDIIIHEFPYMLHYDLFFGLDHKPRIYNSHNYESNLISQMWKGPNAEKYISMIQGAERTLVQSCALVFATSEEEREAFSQTFGRRKEDILLAPNGIEVSKYERLRSERRGNLRKKAFFIGSAHPPNLEAVHFLIDDVAPACPDVDFYIAGKCSTSMECDVPNIHLMGLVSEEEKDDLFATSDVAVNPMFSGAGTNLKTLEFLSAGIPMVSTYTGVRGLGLTEKEHYVHAEREDFAEKLNELLHDPEHMAALEKNGRAYINSNFSWDTICESVHNAIETLHMPETDGKPLILAMNDYSVDAPIAGGEVRIHYLLRYLSEQYKIVYLCLNDGGAVRKTQICRDFIQISLPKTAEHLKKEQDVNAKCWISANDIVAGNMIRYNRLFVDAVRTLYALADIVILEHPYLVDCLDGLCGKPVIYESHNFEYGLKCGLLEPHPEKQWLCAETERLERKAVELSSMVVCCSSDELPKLTEFAHDSTTAFEVIRNGVEFTERRYDYQTVKRLFDGRSIAIFVGSGHSPNVDAAAFILRGLAKQTPQVAYLLIGSVCEAFQSEPLEENVLLMGKLSAEHKDFLLYAADVALNPVNEGAGSNLKLAEYFAYGIPTVTTPFGARGYAVENGKHAVICEREQFAQSILELLDDKKRCKELSDRAYEYARSELSWQGLAAQYAKVLGALDKKRLLFVTYRYNQPPRGGAEVYVENVLTEIAKRSNYLIDIAATEIGDIANRFHYSCDYTIDAAIPETETGICVRKFSVDTLPVRERWEKCNTIYQSTMAESVALGRKFVDRYSEPVLMGGWHFPETYEDGTHIWSSGEADIFLANADAIELMGHSNRRKKLQLLVDDKKVKTETISGRFVLRTELPAGDVCTIITKADSFTDEDARPLGIYLDSISCRCGGIWKELDICNDFRHIMSETDLSVYINAMIDAAQNRPEEIDALFYETRGPLSTAMAIWLEKHIAEYDVVIGHSIPFDTLVLAQRAAKSQNVPFVALPHFHMEDPFYHWPQYYRSLTEANRVIAAPNISKDLFYDKIGANALALPGGGVFLEEFNGVSEKPFQKAFGITQPFILVLGRKAGGKNYQWVIDAVDEVNRRGTSVRLVMIGRDDDKNPIDAPNTTYLGEQPREMVLSALRACEFVVNMSESESFGIVILEAWLSGKTVIVNQGCAAFRELVDDGVNGLLVRRDTLANAIESLLRNERRLQMAHNGETKAEDYSWGSLAEKIELLCDEVRQKRKT